MESSQSKGGAWWADLEPSQWHSMPGQLQSMPGWLQSMSSITHTQQLSLGLAPLHPPD